MTYRVVLTEDALRDLEDIDDYLVSHDSEAKADHVLKRIEAKFKSLAQFPERGSCPKELGHIGIREFREIFFKPYRIIYRVQSRYVHVLLITDGRRDMQALLSRRLLHA